MHPSHTQATLSHSELRLRNKTRIPRFYGSQVDPNDIVVGGWDMSNMNLADAMSRAKVLDIDLQKQLWKYMKDMVPLPGIYNSSFVASNQDERANNVIKGTKREQVNKIAQDIR